ncbi:hypothetical protein EDC18_11417 [Natranaerovirga pectinivora]|uniref:Uncharacterized protein n=1 Tax=Natranaerovirga pectinivora TaxID=682400 RepID=A0A4V2UZP5_9FIRM|nr:hypothetical protein [Natranaerovirga pectinivora]TCT12118.1 hypothetical protein EDC18_11417 [Natranaerovirga pectinivora]
MSLFLGDIHFWLYNKIIWAERLEDKIIELAKEKGLPAEEWKVESYDKFGEPTGGKDLESIIDTSNIHGWLQQKISNVETRQGFLITKMLEVDDSIKESIIGLFKEQGALAATHLDGEIENPEEVFNALNNFVIEGMPCDRVNQIVTSTDTKFVWTVTACLHKPYWDRVAGDIEVFYELREAWVKSFVENLSGNFTYEKSGFTHTINKN